MLQKVGQVDSNVFFHGLVGLVSVTRTHRIENPGKIPVHIIEVQSGSYLGEDDIVRFEDRYGRQGTTT